MQECISAEVQVAGAEQVQSGFRAGAEGAAEQVQSRCRAGAEQVQRCRLKLKRCRCRDAPAQVQVQMYRGTEVLRY